MRRPTSPETAPETPRYLYWTKRGIGGVILEMPSDRLTNLAAAYTQKGMAREAQIFQEHLEVIADENAADKTN